MVLDSVTREQGFLFWTVVWIITLILPPGSTAIFTAYRLNFIHGLSSSIVAILCLYGYLPESVTTTATISYFIVDFVNILINDFYFKAPSYQKPSARRTEYFHHIFCCFVGVMCEYRYTDYCSYTSNPFTRIMFAEFPTPFLMAWRYSNSDIFGGLFVVVFFFTRLVYQGFYLVPEFMKVCHPSVSYGFGIPFNLMNFYFFYFICQKFLPSNNKGKSKDTQSPADGKLKGK